MTPRSRAGGALAAVAALLLVAAGVGACGVDTDDRPRTISWDNVPAELTRGSTTTVVPLDEDELVAVPVWFIRSRNEEVSLIEWVRRVPSPATDRGVLEALLTEGPTEAERQEGLATAIPDSTTLASPPEREPGGVLVIDLSDGLFDVQSYELRNAYGQIVCTATDIEGVERVRFENEGRPINALDGTGESADGPVGCEDYRTLYEEPPTTGSSTTPTTDEG